jgi:single stranded DNA-binding protein (ssb)
MASFNNCTFSGNVGRDPEIRYLDSGMAVANFSIAVEGRNKGQGKGQDTLWLAVVVWGKGAGVIGDYVKKGSRLIVSGELGMETWEKDGKQNSKLALNCQNFTLLDSKKDSGGAPGGGGSGGGTSRPAARSRPSAPVEEEDLPF